MPIKRACLYDACPVEAALDLIGGKWRTMILATLLDGPIRFNDMKRRLQGVSQRVLTAQLRDLEQCGLITRQVFPQVPPRVEYSLTDLGLTLRPLLGSLKEWGMTYAMALRSSNRPPATV